MGSGRRRSLLAIALLGCVSSLATADEQGVAGDAAPDLEVLKQQFDSAFDQGFGTLYREHCAVCHGSDFRGSPQGPALIELPGADASDADRLPRTASELDRIERDYRSSVRCATPKRETTFPGERNSWRPGILSAPPLRV